MGGPLLWFHPFWFDFVVRNQLDGEHGRITAKQLVTSIDKIQRTLSGKPCSRM
jgi:hypothetical protein